MRWIPHFSTVLSKKLGRDQVIHHEKAFLQRISED